MPEWGTVTLLSNSGDMCTLCRFKDFPFFYSFFFSAFEGQHPRSSFGTNQGFKFKNVPHVHLFCAQMFLNRYFVPDP